MMTPAPEQASRLRSRAGQRGCRTITVTSGKGGVGKTTLTANLGLELAKRGASVVLLDGAFGVSNLALLFNRTPEYDLENVLEGRRQLSEILIDVAPNLRLIPAGQGIAPLAELTDTTRQHLFAEIDALTAQADFMLVDTGAGISSTVLALIGLAERTLVVTTHEPTALYDAYGLIKAAHARGAARLELVVNMAASHIQARDTHGRLSRLTERFAQFSPGLAAIIPREECVGQAIVRQQPLTVIYPYAQATRAIAALARLCADRPGATHDAFISLAVPVRR
jgi:flagellar biosynthesis protein FlhG